MTTKIPTMKMPMALLPSSPVVQVMFSRNCVSHHNIDDGWDLYTKSDTGPIGAITVRLYCAFQWKAHRWLYFGQR